MTPPNSNGAPGHPWAPPAAHLPCQARWTSVRVMRAPRPRLALL